KLYDILRQHQNEVNEIRAKRLVRTTNLLALVSQQQLIYHPQNRPNHYTKNSSTRSQQAATKNRGKAIVNSPLPTYDQEPTMVAEDDKMLKEKENDKLMALISLSFKKIYKPTNNNLKTSSNTVKHIKIILQESTEELEEAGIQLSTKQAYWRDDIDDEPKDQELEAHILYMAHIQQVIPDAAKHSGPIFDIEPLQKVQNDDDNCALENKVKVLDDIVYKTGQLVQTMIMLNSNCKTSFVKPEFLKKAQRANPCLYDISCYNDNLALMLAFESDETIRLAQESRSK
nr:hypothetical protein [Tanacetum cinerariifolium]